MKNIKYPIDQDKRGKIRLRTRIEEEKCEEANESKEGNERESTRRSKITLSVSSLIAKRGQTSSLFLFQL